MSTICFIRVRLFVVCLFARLVKKLRMGFDNFFFAEVVVAEENRLDFGGKSDHGPDTGYLESSWSRKFKQPRKT